MIFSELCFNMYTSKDIPQKPLSYYVFMCCINLFFLINNQLQSKEKMRKKRQSKITRLTFEALEKNSGKH